MFAVIRIRGRANIQREIKDVLKMLRLNYVHNCVLVPETPEHIGMLRKAKDCVTWGKVSEKTLTELLKKRGRISGNKLLDDKILKNISNIDSFEKLAKLVIESRISLKDIKKLKPVFRLNPPRKGFRSSRLLYPRGDLGFRKDGIDKLLERMI